MTIRCAWVGMIILSIGLSGETPSFAGKVRGYRTKRGTYVAPYQRTDPDSTIQNNYSTKGNVNPYTGKEGTVTKRRRK